MRKFLSKYIPFLRGAFEVGLSYRTSTFFWILGETIYVLVMVLIWSAIFKNSDQEVIKGFTLTGMITYNIIIYLVSNLTWMNPLWTVSDDYTSGRIAMSLIKPINYRIQVFFISLGESLFVNVALIIPLLIIVIITSLFVNLEVTISVLMLLSFFISIILAIVINFYIYMIFANLVFYTQASFGLWNLSQAIVRIFSGALIPLTFFPDWLRTITDFLPFAHVQYVPTMIFLNKVEGMAIIESLLMQVVWAFILALISHYIWNRSIKKVIILGG